MTKLQARQTILIVLGTLGGIGIVKMASRRHAAQGTESTSLVGRGLLNAFGN